MVSSDLTAEGDSGLAGYWGGFSGDVDGETFGFLSPLFDGDNFHGKAVQVYAAGFAFVKRACRAGGLRLPRGTDVLDLIGLGLSRITPA